MSESISQEAAAGRLLAIVSGRGGAGKTTLTLNLALALAARGRRVLVVDADMGLANISALLQLRPEWEVTQLLRDPRRLDAALLPAVGGIHVLQAFGGLEWLSAGTQPGAAAELLAALRRRFDDVLVDTPATLGTRVAVPAAAADQLLLLITPDQTALTDGFTLVRSLVRAGFGGDLGIVVNMAASEADAGELYRRFSAAIGKYATVKTVYMGHLCEDRVVTAAAVERAPVLLHAPASEIADCYEALAQRLLPPEPEPPTTAPAAPPAPASQPARQPPRGRAPEAKELIYSLLEGPGLAEPAFRELLQTLESIYQTRFGRAPRDPSDRLLEALEADAVSDEGLRVLSRRLHRRLYGEPLEDRIAPLLRDLLGSTALTEDRWETVRAVLEEVYQQQFGEPMAAAPVELNELARELARQRPQLEDLRGAYADVAQALSALEMRLRERAGRRSAASPAPSDAD